MGVDLPGLSGIDQCTSTLHVCAHNHLLADELASASRYFCVSTLKYSAQGEKQEWNSKAVSIEKGGKMVVCQLTFAIVPQCSRITIQRTLVVGLCEK